MTVCASRKKAVYYCCYNYALLRHIGLFVIRKNQKLNEGVECQLIGSQLRFKYISIGQFRILTVGLDLA